MDWDAFFKLHDDLPREGPGTDEDVAWACALGIVPGYARILDAGSGPGGDIAALLRAAPEGRVLAVDMHQGFVDAVARRFEGDKRVTAKAGSMMREHGPFDLIWSGGAVYFVGVAEALNTWRKALAPEGIVAFSEPCLFRPAPDEAVKTLFEEVLPDDEAGICAKVEAAGYEVLGTRRVSDAGWEAYYQPQEARIEALRVGADDTLNAVLDEAEAEIATWRKHREDFGYLLCVVRPA